MHPCIRACIHTFVHVYIHTWMYTCNVCIQHVMNLPLKTLEILVSVYTASLAFPLNTRSQGSAPTAASTCSRADTPTPRATRRCAEARRRSSTRRSLCSRGTPLQRSGIRRRATVAHLRSWRVRSSRCSRPLRARRSVCPHIGVVAPAPITA